MHLDFIRDTAKRFPSIDNPAGIRSLKVWHCKYSSLKDISNLINLEKLVIASFPDRDLEMLIGLTKLRYLKIMHMPKVTQLSPLKALKNLESLSLSTLPTWDVSGKKTIVDSLEAIASLQNLKHLELFGVCPPDSSLSILEHCPKLESARFSQYPPQEVERFYSTTGVLDQFNPTE